MERKIIYEKFSLLVGLGAILTLTWGIILGLFFGIKFQLHEPIVLVAIIEILFGIACTFYYFKKIFKN